MLEVMVAVVILVIFIVIISVIQQNREKREAARRKFVHQQKMIIQSTESVLMSCAEIPMRNELKIILQRRIIKALIQIVQSGSASQIIKQKLVNLKGNLSETEVSTTIVDPLSDLILHNEEPAILKAMQQIKEIRRILHSQHKQGAVEPLLYQQEDRTLSLMQTKLAVEAHYKRALSAKNNNMPGSARQAFERTLSILDTQTHQDNYVLKRTSSINQHLQEIKDSLTQANEASVRRKTESERNSLDQMFEPKKKKW